MNTNSIKQNKPNYISKYTSTTYIVSELEEDLDKPCIMLACRNGKLDIVPNVTKNRQIINNSFYAKLPENHVYIFAEIKEEGTIS